jgi:uncharacterized protein YheU (UPF0270 family)
MKLKIPRFVGLVLTFSVAFSVFVPSAWPIVPQGNNPVCIFESAQYNPVAVSHPSGGAIIVWQDERNGNSDIYAQRLCGCDSLDWISSGTPVCTANGEQQNPVIINDSSGGVIIAWEDNRNGNYAIYAQKMNAWGVAQWALNGVAVAPSVSSFDQRNPVMIGDSAGGAIVIWEDKRVGSDFPGIYAQRITQDGVIKWDSGGAAVCVQTADRRGPQAICNFKGEAVIVWQDKRSGNYDIYAQRIDTSGAALWPVNGVAISSDSSDQLGLRMRSDGKGGAIVVWNEVRNAVDFDIFAQRIGAEGAVKWAAEGIVISNMSGNQLDPVIANDGDGGAIIAWEDKRAGTFDIYGQRIDSSGIVRWAPAGVSICSAPGDQVNPQILKVYSGGADIAWVDSRHTTKNIFIQQITADGVRISATDGAAVCNSDSDQINPILCDNGREGAIAVWQDFRNKNSAIYARIIPRESLVTGLRPAASVETPPGNGTMYIDQSGRIHYTVETAGRVSLEILDLSGRLRSTLALGYRNQGSYSATIPDNRTHGGIPCGVYFCRVTKNNSISVQKVSIMR